jgi:hypothetical protein
MWTGGVYLLLLTQLLENKVVIELTEADYVEAQKVCNLWRKKKFWSIVLLDMQF